MTEEFNLSEKRNFDAESETIHEKGNYVYKEEDVKEFIKRLNEHIDLVSGEDGDCLSIQRKLKELAGDKLI